MLATSSKIGSRMLLMTGLVTAVLLQTVSSAPAAENSATCNECCCGAGYEGNNNQQLQQQVVSSGQQRFQKSSASSSYRHQSGSTGLQMAAGPTNARLETFDENTAVSNNNNNVQQTFEKPTPLSPLDNGGGANWQEEKHYVSEDGKGEMIYKAGQTKSDNGYTKFSQHKYSYSSSGVGSPAAGNGNGNAQVLSNEDFGRELDNIRAKMAAASSMSKFGDLGNWDDWNKAMSQLQNICDSTSFTSSAHSEALRMMSQIESSMRSHRQRRRRDAPAPPTGDFDKIIAPQITTMESNFEYLKNPSCEYMKKLRKDKKLSVAEFKSSIDQMLTSLTKNLDNFGQSKIISDNLKNRINKVKEEFDASKSKIRRCFE